MKKILSQFMIDLYNKCKNINVYSKITEEEMVKYWIDYYRKHPQEAIDDAKQYLGKETSERVAHNLSLTESIYE